MTPGPRQLASYCSRTRDSDLPGGAAQSSLFWGPLLHPAERRPPSAAPLPQAKARVYFQQLVSAVYYCHSQGICHRDLKLENCLLAEAGSMVLKARCLPTPSCPSRPSHTPHAVMLRGAPVPSPHRTRDLPRVPIPQSQPLASWCHVSVPCGTWARTFKKESASRGLRIFKIVGNRVHVRAPPNPPP